MGLLTQTLAGMVQGGANAGMMMMLENMKAEREAAAAARKENFEWLKMQQQDTYEQAREQRRQGYEIDKEERARKYTGTLPNADFRVNGEIASNDQVASAIQQQAQSKSLISSGNAAEEGARNRSGVDVGPLASSDYTNEEQSAIDSAVTARKNTPSITSAKESAMEEKHKWDMDKEHIKNEFRERMINLEAELKVKAAEYRASLKNGGGNDAELKQLDRQLKGMEVANKILTVKEGEAPTQDQIDRANTVLSQVGIPTSKATSREDAARYDTARKQAEKEAKGGIFGSDKPAEWIEKRTQELVGGNQPVAGKAKTPSQSNQAAPMSDSEKKVREKFGLTGGSATNQKTSPKGITGTANQQPAQTVDPTLQGYSERLAKRNATENEAADRQVVANAYAALQRAKEQGRYVLASDRKSYRPDDVMVRPDGSFQPKPGATPFIWGSDLRRNK